MIDIMKFFRTIYIYISSKFKNNSYENINQSIFNDNVNDNKIDNFNDNYITNKNSFEIYDEEYEVLISNIHTPDNL
jgi:hypothetical protein